MKLSCWTAIFFCLISSLQAQEIHSLQSIIEVVEKNESVKFSYSPSLIQNVSFPRKNWTAKGLVQFANQNSAFKFERIDDDNVVVKPLQQGKDVKLCITVRDVENGDVLYGAGVLNSSNQGFIVQNENDIHYLISSRWEELTFQFVGYKQKTIDLVDIANQGCVSVELEEINEELDEVVILSYLNDGVNYEHATQSIKVNIDGAGLLPGETETDVLTSVEAVPGINSPDGKAGNLILRGDDPDKTLITFDNIPIYHNGHYFGAFSPYNTDVLESISISRSGYSADKGGRVGGAVELKSKGRMPDSLEARISGSTMFLSGYANIPLMKDKLTLMVAGRGNYPFSIPSPKMDAITDFVFQNSALAAAQDREFVQLDQFGLNFKDYNGKLIFAPSDRHRFDLSFLNIEDDFVLKIKDDHKQEKLSHSATLRNYGANLNYRFLLNDKVINTSSLTLSSFNQQFYSKIENKHIVVEESNYNNKVGDLSFKNQTQIDLGERRILDFGYQYSDQELYSYRDIIRQIQPFEDMDSNRSQIHTVFASMYRPFAEKIDVKFGVRSSWFALTKKLYFEPRVQANYYVNSNLTVKLNSGLYNQFVNHLYGTRALGPGVENYNWRLSNGTNTPVVSGKQLMLGAIYEKKGWVIDMEAYLKKTEDVAIHNQEDYFDTENHYLGDYTTNGVDFLVKKSWNGFDGWLAYTWSSTLAKFDSIQETQFSSIWNQNHLFNAVLGYSFRNFRISAGWKYKSGLATLTGIRYLYMNGPFTAPIPPTAPSPDDIPYEIRKYTPRSDPDYGDQFPDHHQLDVSVSYFFESKSKKWNCSIGASVFNVYNKKIIIGQVENLVQGQNAQPNLFDRYNLYGMGVSPGLQIRIGFN